MDLLISTKKSLNILYYLYSNLYFIIQTIKKSKKVKATELKI